MALSAAQLDLLKTAANALAGWNSAAQGLAQPVLIAQVTMEFPPEGSENLVRFTWMGDHYDIQID